MSHSTKVFIPSIYALAIWYSRKTHLSLGYFEMASQPVIEPVSESSFLDLLPLVTVTIFGGFCCPSCVVCHACCLQLKANC